MQCLIIFLLIGLLPSIAPGRISDPGDLLDSMPDIATDGKGFWVVAWSRGVDFPYANIINLANSTTSLLYSTSSNGGRNWTAELPVHPHFYNASYFNYSDAYARVAYTGGLFVIVWQNTDFGTHLQKISTSILIPGASNWTKYTERPGGQAWDAYPVIAGDGVSTFMVACGTVSGSIAAMSSSDKGNTWTALLDILDPTLNRVSISFGNGRWVLLFGKYISDNATDVFSVYSEDNGSTWSALIPIFTDASSSENNFASLTFSNGVFVGTWESRFQWFPNTVQYSFNAPAVSSLNGSTWTNYSFLNIEGANSTNLNDDWDPVITSIGPGRWLGIYFAYDIELSYVFSSDLSTWTAPQTLNNEFGYIRSGLPRVTSDGTILLCLTTQVPKTPSQDPKTLRP